MKLLFDLFPVILFVITYEIAGMYPATAVAMIVISIQSIVIYMKKKELEPMNKAMLCIVLILGGATLFFRNEIFFKWKPTAINWGFALAFLGSHYFGDKPLLRRMMDGEINLPNNIWTKLSVSWIAFFFLMGAINLFVAYTFDTHTWVMFKFFGVMGFTLLFAVIQAIFLSRHVAS